MQPNTTLPTPAVLEYTGNITQSGTDAPTVTIFKNDIGELTWTYESTGTYKATKTGAFKSNKILITIGNKAGGLAITGGEKNDDNSIFIQCTDTYGQTGIDGQLYKTPITIKIYK